ncbi:hypothetical protein KFK09_028176 [Dendrobium nobile]|uniref:Uncharacterized protein n=1 Tax=Dendrobium nobile TaxID=94219 RepID=A0A8T3A2G2_DENNO|nr:hypothetical protein KFK09_028176 [Dendrobium nobile]
MSYNILQKVIYQNHFFFFFYFVHKALPKSSSKTFSFDTKILPKQPLTKCLLSFGVGYENIKLYNKIVL